MKTPLDNDLNKVYEAFNQSHDHLREKLMASLPARLPNRATHIRKSIAGTIMKTKIIRLAAAAAVIVVAVLIGMHYFGGSIDMTSVAWADLAGKVEHIENVVYRITVTMTGLPKKQAPQAEALVYTSLEYGTRMEKYIGDELAMITYIVPKERIYVTVIPTEKKYVQMVIPPDKAEQMNEENDPRLMIKQVMSTEYEQLGPDQINGVDVEGIEAKGPRVMGGMFEYATARLWVEIGTDLPVRAEIEGVVAAGQMQMRVVMDDFQWNVELEPSLFEPNIPADYVSKKMDMPKVNEATAVDGLRAFAELTDGRYPSSLAMMTLMKEISETLKTKHGDKPTKEIKEEKLSALQSVLPAGGLYVQLVRENKDVAYYGDMVTAEDGEKVLMRWKISDDQFRVIFGDLTIENVSAAELAELESVQLEE